jgi:hypothetical protein
VAEVEIGLATVVGHEDLTVLERVHRSRIDVDVRVEFLHRDPKAPTLEEPSERRSREAFAETGSDPTRHEDVLRQTNYLHHHPGAHTQMRYALSGD